jgi:hypothetical protein
MDAHAKNLSDIANDVNHSSGPRSKFTALDRDTMEFAIFCIEEISERLEIPGDKVYRMLTYDSDILDTYIIPYYDTLHTQGKSYIVDDIISLMKKEGLQV